MSKDIRLFKLNPDPSCGAGTTMLPGKPLIFQTADRFVLPDGRTADHLKIRWASAMEPTINELTGPFILDRFKSII